MAEGHIESGEPIINVGRHSCDFSALLQPESLFAATGPCRTTDPDSILCWPEHFSVVLLNVEAADTVDERISLVESLSRRLLSCWTSPHTSFANPEHMEAMAEFAAGAGHEINNPLGSIIGQTQLLLKSEERADHRQALETIGAQAWRIRDMIGDTMLFARPPQPEFTWCDLGQIAQKVVTDQNAIFGADRGLIRLLDPQEKITIFADESQIASLLSHLVRNACEAVCDDAAGDVVVQMTTESKRVVSIDVTDNGAPIPEVVRRHLFDPFFSGRQAGRGLGFGLCLCWQTVRMHNGVLTHESLEFGNRFIVLLPLESAADNQRDIPQPDFLKS